MMAVGPIGMGMLKPLLVQRYQLTTTSSMVIKKAGDLDAEC